MNKIVQGMTQVNLLIADLGDYYIAHPTPQNEILVKVSLFLEAYNLALDYLVHAPAFGEAEIGELIEILQPHDPDEAALLQQVLPQIQSVVLPEHRQEIRQAYANRLMKALNMHFDVGRQLLRVRELRDQGATSAEIEHAIQATLPDNPF
ncbi:MAG: hypothetical protein ACUVR2_12860 [Anaerolineae bacterium]